MTSRIARKTTLFFTLLVVNALTADAGELKLRKTVVTSASVVRLGELAEFNNEADQQRLADIVLLPSPRPGLSRRVTAQDVRETLSILGHDTKGLQITGASEIASQIIETPTATLVERTAHVHEMERTAAPTAKVISHEADDIALVTKLIHDHLANRDRSGAAWIVTPRFLPDQAKQVAIMQQAEISGGTSPFTGRQVFTIRDLQSTQSRPVYLKVDVDRSDMAVVARRRLEPGMVISTDDVELREVPTSQKPQLALPNEAAAVGMQATKVVAPGQILQTTQLRRRLLVLKGEDTTVVSLAAGIMVKASARALSDGALGDVILLQTAKGKPFQARVVGPQETMVLVDSPQVTSPAARQAGEPKPTTFRFTSLPKSGSR